MAPTAKLWTAALALVAAGGCSSFDVPLSLVVPDGQAPLDGLDHLVLEVDYGDGRAYAFVNEGVPTDSWSLGEVPPGDAVVLGMEGRVNDPLLAENSLVVASGRVGPLAIGPDTAVEADGARLLFTRRGTLGRLSGALDDGLAHHAAVALQDGGVVSFGGRGATEDEGTRKILRFGVDGSADSLAFREVGSMSSPRRDHAAVTLQDGRVLVVGTVALYDARSASRVLIDQDSTRALEEAREAAVPEIYDPADDTLAPLFEPDFEDPAMQVLVRGHHTLTPLDDGRILVAGGVQFDDIGGLGVYFPGDTLLIDPAAGSGAAGPRTNGRLGHTATKLDDGRVLVVGSRGLVGSNLAVSGEADVFDPSGDVFTRVGSIAPARGEHGAALLPDGRVVVFGGAGDLGDTALGDSWLFDPRTDSWASGPPMLTPRWRPAVAMTGTGRVLVCGGADEAGAVVGCEIFVPVGDGADGWVPAPDPGGVAEARDGTILVPLGTGDLLGVGGVLGTVPTLDLLLYRD